MKATKHTKKFQLPEWMDDSKKNYQIVKNLCILALYLKSMPRKTRKFCISEFACSVKEGIYREISPFRISERYNECGTCCCAAGHGPLAGIKPYHREKWVKYTTRNFLPILNRNLKTTLFQKWCNDVLFNFIFGTYQLNITHYAAIRIAAVVTGVVTPTEDRFIMNGRIAPAQHRAYNKKINWNVIESMAKTPLSSWK